MKGNFKSIIESPVPVVIDLYAEWCGPCSVQSPVIKEIAEELGNRVKVIKIDVDKNPEIANRFGVQGVPTLMVFKDGNMRYRKAGVHSKPQLMNILATL